MTINEVLKRNAKNYKYNNAVYYCNQNELKVATHQKVYELTLSIATLLNKYINKNIIIIGKNSLEWLISYYAIVSYVGVVIPLDPDLTITEIENILNKTNCSLIIYSEDYEEKLKSLACEKTTFTSLFEKIDDVNFKHDLPTKKASDLAIILFTSGTMSNPKGVEITQKLLFANSEILKKRFRLTNDQNFLAVLPFYHIYAQNVCVINAIYNGMSITICRGTDELSFVLKNAQPTGIVGVPLLFKKMQDNVLQKAGDKRNLLERLIKINLFLRKFNINLAKVFFKRIDQEFGGKLRFMTSAAVALPVPISRFFYGLGYPIFEGYGLTETSPVIAVNCWRNNIFGSVGKLMENQDIRIDNADENGIGEIIVKGDNVTKSYYKDKSLNNKYFDKQGFYHTEDLGYVDSKNYLWIVGRLKNMLVGLDGRKIYPEELEIMLLKFAEIEECIIYEKNARLVAKIYTKHKEQAIQKVIAVFNKQLPRYKQITKFEIVDKPFEKVSNIKIKRSTTYGNN